MNNWIPVIVILAVLAGGGYYAYRKIKRKVEDVSQALFGTDSLVEGWNKQADELAATPKSVSGMTRILIWCSLRIRLRICWFPLCRQLIPGMFR